MTLSLFKRVLRKVDRPLPTNAPFVTPPKEAPQCDSAQMRDWYPSIIGMWGITSAATNPEDFRKMLITRGAWPAPDAECRSASGYPLLTGRVRDLDTHAANAFLEKARAANRQEGKPPDNGHARPGQSAATAPPATREERDVFVRMLALIGRLFDDITPDWPLMLDDAAAARQGQTDKPPAVHIKLLLPASLDADALAMASAFLAAKSVRLPVCAEWQECEALSTPADGAAALLDRLLERLAAPTPLAMLLVTCESMLCSHPRRIALHAPAPGEGAFGILFANPGMAPLAAGPARSRMSRIAWARRDVPADAAAADAAAADAAAADAAAAGAATPSHECLSGVLERAMTYAGVPFAACSSITSDAGQHRSHVMELAGAVAHRLPGIDLVHHHLPVGEACGNLGIAALAGVIIAASAQTEAAGRPVMAITLSDAVERAAVVILPSSRASAAAAGSAAAATEWAASATPSDLAESTLTAVSK